MKRFVSLLLLTAALLAVPSLTRAGGRDPDEIFTYGHKGKPTHRSTIVSESPKGLFTKERKDIIPAEDIEDITFPLLPLTVRTGMYRPGQFAERDALKAKDDASRLKLYDEAVNNFEKAHASVAPAEKFAKSHLAYKIGVLRYQMAQLDNKEESRRKAAKKLAEFADGNPQAWQLSRALKLLATVYLELNQPEEAEKVWSKLAAADVIDEVRQDAQVQALLVNVKLGKHEAATVKLESLVTTLPKNSRQQLRAQLALAECHGEAKNIAKAKGVLKQVLDATKDNQMRAMAYNTMGWCYFKNNQMQDARWEFLWVDVIYNQDAHEHAKALFYLSEIFAQLGDGERARECSDLLRNDRRFAGSEFQQRLMREGKQ